MALVQRIEAEEFYQVFGEDGERWIQNAEQDEAGNVCWHGGIVKICEPRPGDAIIIRQVERQRGRTEEWNDDSERSWSDILVAINGGIDIQDAELEELYGPQYREIVALVRRAAVLTADDMRCTEAAAGDAVVRAAAWDAVREAARSASWALVIRDLITPENGQAHYDILRGPWCKVIGPIHPDDAPLEAD